MKLGIYFTLGDFGLAESVAILSAAAQAGASLLEVGLPFSDPLLDGPVIQASHTRALSNGELPWNKVCAGLAALAALRTTNGLQISVMASSQLFYDAKRSSMLPAVDGLLVTDIAYGAISPVVLPSPRVWFLSQDVALSPDFKAPPEEISMVYLTRLQGVTGAGQLSLETTREAIKRVQGHTKAPVWLGFGISTKQDLAECAAFGADGAIIGSAFVSAMLHAENLLPKGTDADIRIETLRAKAHSWVSAIIG